MIECAIQNISKSFGANKIFENISFEIKTQDKIGLIGPNGIGKSTILKILMGKEDCQGNVAFRKGVTPGYLEQSPKYDDSYTGAKVLDLAFEGIYKVRDRMHELELQMENAHDIDSVMDEYATLQVEYERLGGYDTKEKQSKVIEGLKISDSLLSTCFNNLSGGEKTKIILGEILLEEPPLLLLDEPSNHLDLSTIQWLESYISQYRGAVVIVSHDRYFLDIVANKIVELAYNEAFVFHGNYSHFVKEKKARYDLAVKEYRQNQKDIKKVEEQIKRFRIWGVMRDSEKMYKQAKQMERRLEKMEKLDKPMHDHKKMKLKNRETKRTGKDAIVAKNLSKTFGTNTLFAKLDFDVYYRDSVAILGDNGCGKSTLLKILLKRLEPDTGSVVHGTNLNIGYLAQNIIFKDEAKSILEYFQYKYNIDNSVARLELAKVLFVGDDVFKKISVLSGGEKSRLRLCSLMYENVNIMVLDEPTNHLDIESREVLEDILSKYEGTIVFVSHDRYFISKIAKKIVELKNKKLKIYNGNYEYYKSELVKQSVIADIAIAKKANTQKVVQTKSDETIRQNQIQMAKRKLNGIEKEIESIEAIIADIDEKMLEHGSDLEKLTALEQTKNSLNEELAKVMAKWEIATTELEEVEAQSRNKAYLGRHLI